MKTLFAVSIIKGPAWDISQPMRAQVRWSEHAAFMDELAADGFVVLGGPIEGGHVLLVIDAPDEAAIRSTLARDPWHQSDQLRVGSIRHWTILLRAGEPGKG